MYIWQHIEQAHLQRRTPSTILRMVPLPQEGGSGALSEAVSLPADLLL